MKKEPCIPCSLYKYMYTYIYVGATAANAPHKEKKENISDNGNSYCSVHNTHI